MTESLSSLGLLVRHLRGPLNFLEASTEEVSRLFPEVAPNLPLLQRIYLADEEATPLVGFPVLVTRELEALRESLGDYLRLEEEQQARILLRQSHDPALHQAAWEQYCLLLTRATENVTSSSYGRHFPDIFWLHHSLDVARCLKETPRRITRIDLQLGRERGGELKYKVFYRYLDRVITLTYDQVNRLAHDTEEVEQELFPGLLAAMRDNVLLLTEDYISSDLAELGHYFQGYLRIDGGDFRFRLAKLKEWHLATFHRDARLRATAAHVLGQDSAEDSRQLLSRPGYATFLLAHPDYDRKRLPTPEQIQVWERLLIKLKEFELLHGLRRLVILLRKRDGSLVARDRSLNRTWTGPPVVEVSTATRPMDFMRPWVVDPQVARFGMIYDVTDFSHTISVLRRSGSETQDSSFRMMFRFQRRINRLAASFRLRMEKYLGDGAFYSAREAWRMVVVALQIQGFYRQALREGFPFDRGLRIALNYGHYRLLPIHGGHPGEPERYEFFGHGVVELTRLTSGKAMREIEEIKMLLVNLGYHDHTVQQFFAPLAARDMDVVDKREESREFYSYINHNGNLVNEGIVATEQFVEHLASEGRYQRLYRVHEEDRSFVVAPLNTGEGRLYAGLRKLGMARLKGLEPLAVYEVVDGAGWDGSQLVEEGTQDLLSALERDYAAGVASGSG
jgi:hypothetical protein